MGCSSFQDLSFHFSFKLLCGDTCPFVFASIGEQCVRFAAVWVVKNGGFTEFVFEHVEGQVDTASSMWMVCLSSSVFDNGLEMSEKWGTNLW